MGPPFWSPTFARIRRLVHDLRLAARTLRARPLFTVTALVALALGIGASPAVLGVVDAVLVRPLAYADADRLVVVLHGGQAPVARANFLDWKRETRTFARMGAAEMWGPNLTGDDRPERLSALRVSGDVLPLLGVPARIGRTLRAADDAPGAPRVAVIGHELWMRRFGGDRGVLGTTVRLNGESYAVVGVMPPGFRFAPFWATTSELRAPLPLAERATSRGGQSLRVFARLAPGATLAAARADVAAVTSRLEREFPGTNRDVVVVPLKEKVVGDVRPMLLLLLGAVTCVLQIACANVAHMLLARGGERAKEMTVRTALGATRGALVRQLLTESVRLATLGGALGAALGWAGVRTLVALAPRDLPRIDAAHVDGRVLVATCVVSLVAGLACGLVPAARAAREGAGATLRDGGRGATGGRRQARGRRLLIASEFALAVVLLVGAGLMLRTVAAVQAVDPGFETRGVLTAVVSVSGSAHDDAVRRGTFFPALLARLSAIPGVCAAGLVNHAPITGDVWGTSIVAEGRRPVPGEEGTSATYRVVRPGHFRAMGIRLREGRDVSTDDRAGAPNAVVVNEALARRLWPNGSPLGRRLALGDPADGAAWRAVVGVVADVVRRDWTAPAAEEIYVPFHQSADALSPDGKLPASMSIVVRAECRPRGAECDPSTLAPALRAAVWSLDRSLPVADVTTMTRAVATATARPRFVLSLLAAFAAVAATLAAIGLYGVTSYVVARRTREIGVRIALGAVRGDVTRLVVGEALGLVLVGVVSGT